MWQVDLDRGERFDFRGKRNARELVGEYVERAERPLGVGKGGEHAGSSG